MTKHSENPYLTEIGATLPRLLASYDSDPLSSTKGVGDRRYWAWKTQDFPNATPQSAVHGLARLLDAGLLPTGVTPSSILRRIDEAILATRKITSRDGSLAEAFPTEKSFCVTALVAFDILATADILNGRANSAQHTAWLETAAPLVDFICRHDETHAVISNHLATAVAALMRWTGHGQAVARNRATHLLDVILQNQSSEGWFSEYGGADPGYETLGLTYLADVHLRHRELGLLDPLARSIAFLVNFAQPDGSFGGGYAARNTRFLVPGGIEALSGEVPGADTLATFARRSIGSRRVVTLAAIDEPNLAPHFNAYCWAAEHAAKVNLAERNTSALLPCESQESIRKQYPLAGIVIDNTARSYTVISLAKGGYVTQFFKPGSRMLVDAGVVGRADNLLCSTQAFRKDNRWTIDGDRLIVEAPFVAAITERPKVLQFVLLRLLCLTLFHWRPFTEWVKRRLVERLITGQRSVGVMNRREILFGDELVISDSQMPTDVLTVEKPERPFSVIHMASSGYWQVQDDQE